jgi:dephospho-CoA kinase
MGKTTVSNYLASRHGIPVLDADLYSREAVEPGSVVFDAVVARYGASILQPNGTLDRSRLGNIIFNSPPEKLWLEQHIHPFVRDRLESALKDLADVPTLVLVVPLLFEARMTDLVTEIWVVRTRDEQQRLRLATRDRLDAHQIQARIDGQMAIDRKVEQCDRLIDNSSTLEALYQQVDEALAAS